MASAYRGNETLRLHKHQARVVAAGSGDANIAIASRRLTQVREQRSGDGRGAALETLAELIKSEEAKKKMLAIKLHEDLAQTLSAIKVNFESGLKKIDTGGDARGPLQAIVPALQAAIKQVETLATELRPSGLDDFGLVPTINWFCRHFERSHPGISVVADISVPTNYAFGPLSIVIYRIVEAAFNEIAQVTDTDRIAFSLRLTNQMIEVTIDDSPSATVGGVDLDPRMRFSSVRERTLLSGGTFSATRNKTGGITAHATWAA